MAAKKEKIEGYVILVDGVIYDEGFFNTEAAARAYVEDELDIGTDFESDDIKLCKVVLIKTALIEEVKRVYSWDEE